MAHSLLVCSQFQDSRGAFCKDKVTALVAGSLACQAEKAPTKPQKEKRFPHLDLERKEAPGASALREFLSQLPWGPRRAEGGTQLVQAYRLGPDLQN